MRGHSNGHPDARKAANGTRAKAFVKPINRTRMRKDMRPDALIVVAFGEGSQYRRFTPEQAERLAKELLDAAKEAREQLERKPVPAAAEPSVAALPKAA